jgi:hypothetical protein
MLLWISLASAGIKTVGMVGSPGWVPVQPAQVSAVEGQIACLEWAGSGLPRVVSCPVAATGVVSPMRRGSGSGALLGVVDWSPLSVGSRSGGQNGLMAVEASWSTTLVADRFGQINPDDLPAAAEWCRQPASGAVVVAAAQGCARTAVMQPFDPLLPPKVKDIDGRWVQHGEGAWRIEGAKATTCEGPAQVVMVKVIPVSELCAADVLPRALAGIELQMSSFKASPDAVSAPVKGLFGDLARLRANLGDLSASLEQVDVDLKQGSSEIGAIRERIEGLDLNDRRWVSLLTRLEQLTADTAEASVVSGSHRRRLEAVMAEASSLEEKASQPGLDAMLVQRMGGQVSDVLQRLEELEGEINGLIIRVSAMRQGVGYLQGGLAVGLPDAPAK